MRNWLIFMAGINVALALESLSQKLGTNSWDPVDLIWYF
jgi:hypothetical protein